MERVRPALGADAKSVLDQQSAGLAHNYTSTADDAGMAKSKREAAMLISVAEGHLSDGLLKECLEAAEQASKLFSSMKDDDGEADAVRVIIDTQMAQAEDDHDQPTTALSTALQYMSVFEKKGKSRAEACMMLAACSIYTNMKDAARDLDKASSYGKDALKKAQSLKDRVIEANACLALVNTYYQKKVPTETASYAKKAMDIYKELGDKRGEAKANHAVALGCAMTDDMQGAVSRASEAVTIYRSLGDKGAEAREMQSIAQWNLALCKPSAALEAAQESLAIWRELGGSKRRESVATLLVCEALAAAGKGRQGVKLAKAALARFEESGDRKAVAAGLEVLLEAHMHADSPNEALQACNDALSLVRDLGEKRLELNLLHQACMVQLKVQPLEAGQSMRDALRLAQELNDPEAEAQALLMFGYTQIQRMDIQTDKPAIQEALSLVSDAQLLFQSKSYRAGEGKCLMCQACLRSLNKDQDQVLPLAKEAQALFSACGDVDAEACAWRLITESELVAGNSKEAIDAANSWVDVRRASGQRKRLVDAMLKVASLHLESNDQLSSSIAEEAMDISREVGDIQSEAQILCFIAELSLKKLGEGDIEDPDAPLPAHLAAARDKASASVKKAIVLAGKAKNEVMRGLALLLRAQVLTYSDGASADSALRSAIEAEKVFAKTQSVQNQANAQILCGQLYHMSGDKALALKLGNSALDLVRQPGCEDPNIENEAQKFVDMLEPKQSKAAPVVSDAPAIAAAPAAVAKPGLDMVAVSGKLKELIENNIATGDELEADEPLVDAGLDSLASVQLVTDIGREFKISVAASAVFDYPTLATLAAHVVEESGS